MNEKIQGLRDQYRACVKLADETDSKRDDVYLRKEAAEILVELRKVCDHTYTVVPQEYYEGSYCEDRTDAHKEKRLCLVCDIYEYAWKAEDYKALKSTPFARIREDSRYSPMRPEMKAALNNPLQFLLSEMVDMVNAEGLTYYPARAFNKGW